MVVNGAEVGTTNLVSATVYGVENELHWKPTEANIGRRVADLGKSECGNLSSDQAS